MNILLTIVVFIIIFSLLILIHELGHFVMARRAGIQVEEFGFGLPPRIWGKKKGDTIYSINWIPFGGFVRMLGEDATDESMLRKKKSFIAQPIRSRIKVIVAGVVMNFLLAWFLLTVGFTAGMQPLLTPEDVLPAVDDGIIELVEGVKVKSVSEGGFASFLGFKVDDVIVHFNDQVLDENSVLSFSDDPVGIYKVMRDGKIFTYEILQEQIDAYGEDFDLGLTFYDYAPFPRVRVFDVDANGKTYESGIREGDYIISVNGRQVFSVSEFEQLIRGQEYLEYEIYRNGSLEEVIVELENPRKVIVSSVVPSSPAEEAGLLVGDIIVSVNGNEMFDSLDLIEFVAEQGDKNMVYAIERGGERLFYEIEPIDGKIGVYLSELMSYGDEQELSLYNVSLISSVTLINEQKYPFYVSIYKSFNESIRLSKLTATMFVGFVRDLVTVGEVPSSVTGPVGIAQLTHTFVNEGFIPLLRFVAILSLSLAVINILPFPALDGGRLLFIIIELIVGRRVNQKWESYIHALGYALIILLILAVTYSDISRLIN
jgi:regulator of sigma E protease